MHGCTSLPHSKITILQKKEIIWTQESSGFWFVYSLLMNFPASPQLLPLVSVRLALFLSQVPSRSFKKSWTWQLNRTQQFPRVVFHSSSGEFPLARCVFHSSVESWKMIALESEFTPLPAAAATTTRTHHSASQALSSWWWESHWSGATRPGMKDSLYKRLSQRTPFNQIVF